MEGNSVFGGPEDGGSTDEAIISLDKKLSAISVAPEGERVPAFQRLVATALNKSKVLDQLLRVQKLDAYDIEGAILAYMKFMGMADDPGQSKLRILQTGQHTFSFKENHMFLSEMHRMLSP